MEFSLLETLSVFFTILLGEIFGCLFGGGGFFVQPILLAVAVPPKLAVANDIAAAAFGAVGFILTTKQRSPQIRRTAVFTAPTLIIGAFVGGNVLEAIPEEVVKFMILAICTLGFFYTLYKFNRLRVADGILTEEPIRNWKFYLVLIGILLGFYDGISGAGGGIIAIATLSLVMRSDMKTLISMANWVSGISLTAAGCTFLYLGLLDFKLLAIMVPASVLAGFVAARLSDYLSEKFLRGVYGCVLSCLLVFLYYDILA